MHDQDTYARTRAPAYEGGAHEASDPSSKAAVAAETAKETVKDEARTVADTAKQEAGAVVGEARSQVRRIASQARDQATDRVRGQHNQFVDRLRGLADEFQELGGDGDTPGRALVSDLGQRGRRVADYLADRGPEGVVTEVTDFARRRPMAFLAGAVAAGFLVGRLGKNIWKAQSDSGSEKSFVDTTPAATGSMTAGPNATEPTMAGQQWSQPPATGVAAVPPVSPSPAPVPTPATPRPVGPPATAPVTPAAPSMPVQGPAVEPFAPSPYASESYADPTREYREGDRR